MTTDDVLLIDTTDRVRTLTLNRPKSRNALSAELRAKFESLAAPVIGDKRCEQLAEMVQGIDRCPNVRRLMQLTAPGARR